MYAQLGSLKFEGVRGFQSFSRSQAGRNSEIEIANSKSRLQRNGESLESIQLQIRLHVGFGFGDPGEQIQELKTWMNEGQILPFIDGTGTVYGNFVLNNVKDEVEILGVQGKIISALVSIDLLEFYDPNPDATAKRAAINNGFATSPLKVIPVRIVRPGTNVESLASQESKAATILARGSSGDVSAVAAEPEKKASLFQSARAKAVAARQSISDAIARVQSVASVAAKAPDLLDAAETMKTNADLMIQRIDEGDLTNALIQAQSFSDSSKLVESALIPLDLSIILRKP